MTAASNPRIWRAILLTITICSSSFPAYAKYSGGTGEPNDPYRIATAEDLMLLGDSPEDYAKHFLLTADIDLDPNLPGRKVFDKAVIAPDVNAVEDYFQGTTFTGIFDGNGHTISYLTIAGDDYVGLFGELAEAEVKYLGLLHVKITGSGDYVGSLLGSNGDDGVQGGLVTCCYSTGAVGGVRYVGGLVGGNGGNVVRCYSTSAVTGDSVVGGLVGQNGLYFGNTFVGAVTESYSTGPVSGNELVGGFAGQRGCSFLGIPVARPTVFGIRRPQARPRALGVQVRLRPRCRTRARSCLRGGILLANRMARMISGRSPRAVDTRFSGGNSRRYQSFRHFPAEPESRKTPTAYQCPPN